LVAAVVLVALTIVVFAGGLNALRRAAAP